MVLGRSSDGAVSHPLQVQRRAGLSPSRAQAGYSVRGRRAAQLGGKTEENGSQEKKRVAAKDGPGAAEATREALRRLAVYRATRPEGYSAIYRLGWLLDLSDDDDPTEEQETDLDDDPTREESLPSWVWWAVWG